MRLLTVVSEFRRTPVAGLLMYAALRWIASRGGSRVVAIGRREVLELYRKVGLRTLGRTIQSGAVEFELMSAETREIERDGLARYADALRRVEPAIDWQLDMALYPAAGCFHGGAFWDAIGDEFDQLERKRGVINADVLDAWYPPSPRVTKALADHLAFIVRTSPPAGCEGVTRAIARARGVLPECILAGSGSSSLIFLAFRAWLSRSSRVLILDPTYGEYSHVLERIVRCRVDRIDLARDAGYELETSELEARLAKGYDLVVLVNPNSPTGRHVPRTALQSVLRAAPTRTRVWIDEAYVEFAGSSESLESFAALSHNVVVCKSMSKAYALSGLRVAYLCTSPQTIDELRAITPPWSVSLPAQVAAVAALGDSDYYEARFAETHVLRARLAAALASIPGWDVVRGVANFVLCHLRQSGPDTKALCKRCQEYGLFLRDPSSMSGRFDSHAVRIAVKDAVTNQRTVHIIRRCIDELHVQNE